MNKAPQTADSARGSCRSPTEMISCRNSGRRIGGRRDTDGKSAMQVLQYYNCTVSRCGGGVNIGQSHQLSVCDHISQGFTRKVRTCYNNGDRRAGLAAAICRPWRVVRYHTVLDPCRPETGSCLVARNDSGYRQGMAVHLMPLPRPGNDILPRRRACTKVPGTCFSLGGGVS